MSSRLTEHPKNHMSDYGSVYQELIWLAGLDSMSNGFVDGACVCNLT
jgi:hypothetical protein